MRSSGSIVCTCFHYGVISFLFVVTPTSLDSSVPWWGQIVLIAAQGASKFHTAAEVAELSWLRLSLMLIFRLNPVRFDRLMGILHLHRYTEYIPHCSALTHQYGHVASYRDTEYLAGCGTPYLSYFLSCLWWSPCMRYTVEVHYNPPPPRSSDTYRVDHAG